MPNSVTTIGESAFYNCTGLASIDIPNSVTTIGEGAFYNCTGLMNVNIGNSVKRIRSVVFNDCASLTNISIPESVTHIDGFAFDDCTNLKTLVIEDGEEHLYIDDVTFIDSPIEELYLGRRTSGADLTPSNLTIGYLVKSVGMNFRDDYKLENIQLLTATPPQCPGFSSYQYEKTRVTVPAGSLSAYQADEVWKNFWNLQEDGGTGVNHMEANERQSIKTENGHIIVENAQGHIRVYDMAGHLVKSIQTDGGRVEISTPQHGMYIVKVGGETVKVTL